MKLRYTIFCGHLFLLSISLINVCAQEFGFSNTKIKTVGPENKIEINYELTSSSKFKFFDIDAKVNVIGTEYNLSDYIGTSVVGVIGPMQLKGKSKFIKWDSRKNLPGFDNMIKVTLFAVPMKQFRTSSFYFKSALLPGWGSGSLKGGQVNKYFTIGSLVFLGSGLGLYSIAKYNYSKYKNDYVINTSDKRYNKVLNNLKFANYCFIGYGALWLTDLVNLKISLNKKQKSLRRLENKYYIPSENIYTTYFYEQINTKTEIESYIEFGDSLKLSSNFHEALLKYNMALDREPNNPIIINKIQETKFAQYQLEESKRKYLLKELFTRAKYNYEIGNLDSTKYLINEILRIDNKNEDLLNFLNEIKTKLNIDKFEILSIDQLMGFQQLEKQLKEKIDASKSEKVIFLICELLEINPSNYLRYSFMLTQLLQQMCLDNKRNDELLKFEGDMYEIKKYKNGDLIFQIVCEKLNLIYIEYLNQGNDNKNIIKDRIENLCK